MSQTNSYGYSNEIGVYVIGGRRGEQTLMDEINDWLRSHPGVEILDIKYGYSAEGLGYYSAMIIYRG